MMPLKYKKNAPYFRRISNTVRKGVKVSALVLEGRVLSENGLLPGNTVRVYSIDKGIIIERIDE